MTKSTIWIRCRDVMRRRFDLVRSGAAGALPAGLVLLSAPSARAATACAAATAQAASPRVAVDSSSVTADTASAPGDTARAVVADTSFVAPGDTAVSAAPADTMAIVPALVLPTFRYSPFDSVVHRAYLSRHSYSLDGYLEFEPGYYVGRFGPIGRTTVVSRYAFGRGRGTLYLNDIPVNDPQNDIAHLPHFPVSGFGVLLEGDAVGEVTPNTGGLEGRLRVIETVPSPQQPTTFLELSKSTQRNVRQRRVWFASMIGNIGLDFGYDEILNDGYSFDARQLESDRFLWGNRYGESHSRYLTLNFRGRLPNGDRYLFSLRRFLADTVGDLETVDAEHGLGGHLASVSATMGPVNFKLFSRGFDAVSRPNPEAPTDSQTVNLTTAAYADWMLVRSPQRSVTLGGGFETISSLQRVGGAEAENTLHKATARAAAVSEVGAGVTVRLELNGTNYRNLTAGWGGSLAAGRGFGRHSLELYLRRAYRMPNLGELYLPPHGAGVGATISGNEEVKTEFGWEIGGSVTSRLGPLTNELRVFTLRVHRPISFIPTAVGGEDWLLAMNGGRERASVVADRLRVDARLGGFALRLDGGVDWTAGDRAAYFRAVPEWDAHASFRFGRSFFESTSALYVGLDYTHRGNRLTHSGGELPSYDLLNVKLDGRLLAADLYFYVVNVLDEQYETIEGYLMTPRTFVYGIAWQIFD